MVQDILDQRVATLGRKKVKNGAAIVIDHTTGDILAWVVAGARDPGTVAGDIDAVTVPRQPGSATIERFINNLLLDGKKSTARDILYGALDLVAERTQQDPLEVFRKALANVSPAVEVRSRREGGSTYQVPMEVRPERRVALGIRWLIKYADDRREKTMRDKLAGELIAASNGKVLP